MSKITEMNADEAFAQTVLVVGTIRRAGVAAQERCTIPAEWLGKFCDFTFYDFVAPTNGVAIRLGAVGAVTVDLTTVTAKTGDAFNAGGTLEPHIVLGHFGRVRRRIDADFGAFAYICNAATGFLCVALSTGDSA